MNEQLATAAEFYEALRGMLPSLPKDGVEKVVIVLRPQSAKVFIRMWPKWPPTGVTDKVDARFDVVRRPDSLHPAAISTIGGYDYVAPNEAPLPAKEA